MARPRVDVLEEDERRLWVRFVPVWGVLGFLWWLPWALGGVLLVLLLPLLGKIIGVVWLVGLTQEAVYYTRGWEEIEVSDDRVVARTRVFRDRTYFDVSVDELSHFEPRASTLRGRGDRRELTAVFASGRCEHLGHRLGEAEAMAAKLNGRLWAAGIPTA